MRTPLSRRDRAIAVVVPLVLVVLALQQMLLADRGDLSPWKGGGFGMFSTADHVDTRAVRTQLITVDGPLTLELASALEITAAAEQDLLADLRARPDRDRAVQWADAVLATTTVRDGVLRPSMEPLPDQGRSDTAERQRVLAVRVEVWGTEYVLDTDRVGPRHIVTHDVPAPVTTR